MAELLQQASDDQAALAICFCAVAVCGLIMHFSQHVGRWTGNIRVHDAHRSAARPAQSLSPAPRVIHDKAA